ELFAAIRSAQVRDETAGGGAPGQALPLVGRETRSAPRGAARAALSLAVARLAAQELIKKLLRIEHICPSQV
ncbi:MAG: hypothetical protein AB7S59_15805, partial [Parvibaculaceae bacterium]